ncbi:MAG: MFS transporter [Acidobacteria bacterium]|nr:MFS transporter [Acidobacteriota bacterium]
MLRELRLRGGGDVEGGGLTAEGEVSAGLEVASDEELGIGAFDAEVGGRSELTAKDGRGVGEFGGDGFDRDEGLAVGRGAADAAVFVFEEPVGGTVELDRLREHKKEEEHHIGNGEIRVKVPSKWEVVVLLWCAYAVHQADKQIYSVVLAPLRAELGLSGYEAGLVATVFSIVVALVSPLAGALGDRYSKARIVTLAVMVWSLGTIASGLSVGLVGLLVARAFVTGGGEAFYPPLSHALLAGHHKDTRARAISIHQTAQYFGPIASGFAAGWIAQHYGWRMGFVLFGSIGVLLSLVMAWRLRDVVQVVEGGALLAGFQQSFKIEAVRRIAMAFACVLFVTIGYNTFAPAIFGKQFGLSLAEAGFYTALAGNGAAMVGALIGGVMADRVKSKMGMQAMSLACAAPVVVLLGQVETLPVALGALAGIGLFRGIYEGTLAVSLYDHVKPQHRSSAAAIVLLVANLLAAPSAALLGWISDRAELGMAVSAMSVMFVFAAGLLGHYAYRHDIPTGVSR